jgi:trans-aconitate methyltransferase
MDQQCPHPVNSRPWWDDYFQAKWDHDGGSEKTRYFMETVLSHLPEHERAYLNAAPRTILDWGCAFGEGVATLARVFPRSQVAGLDFSKTAIDQARIRNAGHEFIWSEDGAIPRDFDVNLTSNCLAHFEAPLAVLEKHLASSTGWRLSSCPSIFSTPRTDTWNLWHNVPFKQSFRSRVRKGTIQA